MNNWYTQLHEKQLQKNQSLERLPVISFAIGCALIVLGFVGLIINSLLLFEGGFFIGSLLATASLVWFAVALIVRYGGISGVISTIKSQVLSQFTQPQQTEEAQPTKIQAERKQPHGQGF